MQVRYTLLFFLFIVSYSGAAQNGKTSFSIMWYNVENLFDLENDPKTADDDFTPEGRLKWTEKRYKKKLKKIAKVFELQEEMPAVIGLCETENRKVLEDLLGQNGFKSQNYEIVHKESPDHRGIDVAFLYQPSKFQLISYEALVVKSRQDSLENTRDILYVKGAVERTDTLHFLLNHWPSRSGGRKLSDPKRAYAAKIARTKVDDILAKNKAAKIIILGDLNDEPKDASVADILQAKPFPKTSSELLNLMWAKKKNGLGTYNFRGNWNMLDHIIVSQGLLNAKKGLFCTENAGEIFIHKEIVFVNKKGLKLPNRTYVGRSKYIGGTSDHFPVKLTLHSR